MKKLTLILASATALSVASGFANSWNAGVSLGHGSGNLKHETGKSLADPNTAPSKQNFGMQGGVFGVFGGWKTPVTEGEVPIHVGLQLCVDFSRMGTKFETLLPTPGNGAAHTIKMNKTFSAQFIGYVGTKVNGTMIDFRLGYDWGRFQYKNNVDLSKRYNKGGFLLGLGLSGNVTECTQIGLVYDCTLYGKNTFKEVSYRRTLGGQDVNAKFEDVRVKPYIGIAKVQLSYMM